MTLCKKSGCLIAAAVAIGMSCRLVAGSMDAFNQQLQVQSAQIAAQCMQQAVNDIEERRKTARRCREEAVWMAKLPDVQSDEVVVFEEPLNYFMLNESWYALGKLFITSQRVVVVYDANHDADVAVARVRSVECALSSVTGVSSKNMVDSPASLRKWWNEVWGVRKRFCIIELRNGGTVKTPELFDVDVRGFIAKAKEIKKRQDELAAREKERQAALAQQRLEAQKKSDSATKQISKPKVSTPKKDESAGWPLGAVLGWGLVAVSFVVIVYLVNRIRTMRNSGISESQMNASKKDARLKLTWVKCVFRCVAQAWKKFWKKHVEGVDAMPNGVEYFIVSVFLLALYVGWVALIDFQVRVAFECIPFARGIYRLINAILGNFKMKLLVDELMFGLLFSLVVCEIIFAAPIVFLMGRIVRFNFRRLKVANRNRTQIVAFVILLLIMSAMPLLRLVDFCVYFGFVMASIFNWSLREGGCPYSYEALGVVFCCVCCGVWIIRLCRRVENG